MGRLFNAVIQNGYVVRDIMQSMEYWVRDIGVGPFYFIEKANIFDMRYRGEPTNAEISLAFAYFGDLQIELIQQKNDAPSTYRDFLDEGGEGLHHIAVRTDDLDLKRSQLASLGFAEVQSGKGGEQGELGRHVYYDMGGHRGSIIELTEEKLIKTQFFDRLKSLTADWDGSNPIIEIGT